MSSRALLTTSGAAALAIAAGIGYSRFFVPHRLPLPPALPAERREWRGRAGRLSCYVAGTGRPLLLVHSVNAAASAREVLPLFEHLRGSRRTYALDLPGFGFSERGPRDYAVRLFTDALHDVLDLIAADNGDEPVDALAISLSSEFLARAAVERPERFASLALVSPTGFARGMRHSRLPRVSRAMLALIGQPLWARPLFDLLTSRRSIRFFLERTWGGTPDEALVAYDYRTAHQPGAEHAPLAFVSGRLFSPDARDWYARLALPVWAVHGTRGSFACSVDTDWTRTRPNWRVRVFRSGALPHFERPREFAAAYSRFLAELQPATVVSTV